MGANAISEKLKKEAEARRASFLEFLRGDPKAEPPRLPLSIRRSADAVGVSRERVTQWRDEHPDFDDAIRMAQEDAADILEDEATRRAVVGVEEPIYQGGVLVGYKTRYSDGLLETMMTANRPSKFGRASQNILIQNQVDGAPSDEKLARAMALLLAEAKQQQIESK